MALVKANMSFYHDKVGTRAMNEVFEVKQENLVSELEQAGYIQRAEGQAVQAFEQAKTLEQEVGKRNALTNEAVSLAGHEQNQQTLKDQENFAPKRQQAGQAAVEAEISRLEQAGDTQQAENLRKGLESQRQAQQQQQQSQQQQQQGESQYTSPQQMSEHQKTLMEMANATSTQAQMEGNTEIAEAEQAAANSANSGNARARKANK